ncbi:MAG: hypothetical protein JOZ69_05485, partial [Myxococcales bacterium]|nr:hypothetical protein [Myxococcales bacterium]
SPGDAKTAVGSAARSAVDSTLDLLVAVGWSWWGTWFVSMFLALAGGASGASLLSRWADRDRVSAARETERARHVAPLTPAPKT